MKPSLFSRILQIVRANRRTTNRALKPLELPLLAAKCASPHRFVGHVVASVVAVFVGGFCEASAASTVVTAFENFPYNSTGSAQIKDVGSTPGLPTEFAILFTANWGGASGQQQFIESLEIPARRLNGSKAVPRRYCIRKSTGAAGSEVPDDTASGLLEEWTIQVSPTASVAKLLSKRTAKLTQGAKY